MRAEFLQALAERPQGFDLFAVMRRIECLYPERPRLGTAARPHDEPIRFAQSNSLAFAPSAIAAFELPEQGPARLVQHVLGLIGPNGPLPRHLTEYVHDRVHHVGDKTLLRFLDMLTHRIGLLFYRAWAQAQPTVSLDRPADDRFHTYVGALGGIGAPPALQVDALGDLPKLFFVGRLGPAARSADGLVAWLRSFFRAPCRVEEFSGNWMSISDGERSRLDRNAGLSAMLGVGTVIGARVWDVQHKFRIVIGPLAREAYDRFLPGGRSLAQIVALVRQYVGLDYSWDLQVVLRRDQVPPLRLGDRTEDGSGRLGRTAWMTSAARDRDAGDYVIDGEFAARASAGWDDAARAAAARSTDPFEEAMAQGSQQGQGQGSAQVSAQGPIEGLEAVTGDGSPPAFGDAAGAVPQAPPEASTQEKPQERVDNE